MCGIIQAMKNIQQKYFRRAFTAAKILQISPFVRMVGLNGSVAKGEATAESDIDFFIVTESGRIWTSRAFSMVLITLFGIKRFPDKIAGRICLNLYQTLDRLELTCKTKKVAKSNANLVVLWQEGNIYKKFLEKNQWISKKFHFKFKKSSAGKPSKFLFIIQKIIEKIVESDWLESKLKGYQSQRILKDFRTQNSPKGSIFLSDLELRFHPRKTPSRLRTQSNG
jgi:predicted nucleotidyltransferase